MANPHDPSPSAGSVVGRNSRERHVSGAGFWSVLAVLRSGRRCFWSVVGTTCILMSAGAPASLVAQNNDFPTVTEPMFAEIPEACGYLTEELAEGLLRAKVGAGAANEHLPKIWSQCTYSGTGVVGRQVSFVFKFMLWTLFDVESLDPELLKFNVTFVMGGVPPSEKLTDLGKVAFTYENKIQHRTMLLVVTGFQGPPDGIGRPSEFIANYQLADPETPHEERLEKLLAQARRHMAEWQSQTN